jgi:AcrR family transcriptional regulator
VSGPAIYRYFTSKNDILGVLFDRGMDELERATRVDDAAPRERLVLMAHGHASLVMRNPSLASVWLTEQRSLAGLHRARYAARAEGYRTRWSDTLHECFPAARPVTCGALVMPLLAVLNAVDQWPPELRTASTLSRLIDAVVAEIEAALGPPG